MLRTVARPAAATIKPGLRSAVATTVDHLASIDPGTELASDRRRLGRLGSLALLIALLSTFGLGARRAAALDELVCQHGTILAGGDPDPAIFSDEASRGVRASWCERYDAYGRSTRTGPYREVYPSGALRTEAHYVRSRLEGPVTLRNERGGLFLRGTLAGGAWSGRLEIFHPNGTLWMSEHYKDGVLEGVVQTRYPDGALESETTFQHGREDGLARSFYPTKAGGGLKSEVYVEADRLVGEQRIFDRSGKLVRSIDWDSAPVPWRAPRSRPAAPASNPAPPHGDEDRD